MDKIAIIGSNAFIAKHLSKFIKSSNANYSILGFSRYNKNDFIDDWLIFDYPNNVFNFSLLLNVGAIIYCAGTGIQANKKGSIDNIYALNTFFPISIVNFLKKAKYKGVFISFGSYFEIGNNHKAKNFSEVEIVLSDLQVPNDYCVSKRMLSRFMFNAITELNHYHLILPTIYGNGENENRLIPYVLSCIQTKQPIYLTQGMQIRQYLHIKDVSELLILLISNTIHISGIYNVSALDTLSVRELVNILIEEYEAKITLNWGGLSRKDISMENLMLDTSKLNKYQPDWKPSVSLVEGMLNYKTI